MLNTLLAHYGSPTTIICNLRGPWAPRMRVCSISAERDGPVIMLTVRHAAHRQHDNWPIALGRYRADPHSRRPRPTQIAYNRGGRAIVRQQSIQHTNSCNVKDGLLKRLAGVSSLSASAWCPTSPRLMATTLGPRMLPAVPC